MIRPEMHFMVSNLGAWRRVSAPEIIISRILRNNINLPYCETLFWWHGNINSCQPCYEGLFWPFNMAQVQKNARDLHR